MAKQSKLPQTDWTRGGMQISNTAIPLYQENLTRMDNYLSDPQKALDSYLTKYYGSNAIQNQDFLNAYNRAMGQRTGANYAATGGGYTSSGQRAYDDTQKYYNDLVSRLQQYGVGSSYNMANQDYQNMLNANNAYYNAYGLGKNYSQIEQQNALADQQNKNWFSSALGGLGQLATGIGAATGFAPLSVAGGLMQGVGAGTGIDTSNAQNTMASIYGGQATQPVTANDTYTNLLANLAKQDWSPITDVFNKNKVAKQNQQTGLNIRP